MNWSDIDLRPDARKLRQFAAIWLLFFGVLAVRAFVQHKPAAVGLAIVAFAGLIGVIAPAISRPLYVGSSLITFPIGWVVSRLLLAGIYFLVFTPVAIVFRIAGRDLLRLRKTKSDSYWMPRESPAPERYFRQF